MLPGTIKPHLLGTDMDELLPKKRGRPRTQETKDNWDKIPGNKHITITISFTKDTLDAIDRHTQLFGQCLSRNDFIRHSVIKRLKGDSSGHNI